MGKTLSAEATSEHLRRPLYVVGGGDLGTSPREVDRTLEEVFDIANCWNAIVLIDEVRSVLCADAGTSEVLTTSIRRTCFWRRGHRRTCNTMLWLLYCTCLCVLRQGDTTTIYVLHSLRHIEYYRGILFLTTNRLNTFDRAFLSRIHVALHYEELNNEAKTRIWRAFFKKAGMVEGQISDELVERLAQRDVNGRKIKNACRIATFLARSQGMEIQYEHLEQALVAGEIDF